MKILGFLMYPLLYLRYSFVIFLPILFTKDYEMFYSILFLWFIVMPFMMGNLRLMNPYLRFWTRILNVQYVIAGQWDNNKLMCRSIWSHPIIVINNKKTVYSSFSKAGGTLYDEESKVARKAIIESFFI